MLLTCIDKLLETLIELQNLKKELIRYNTFPKIV
jgi:hypothetical protein